MEWVQHFQGFLSVTSLGLACYWTYKEQHELVPFWMGLAILNALPVT